MRRLAASLAVLIVTLLLCVVGVEVFLRFYVTADTFFNFTDPYWEYRFMESQKHNVGFIGGHVFHATRGWTPGPHMTITLGDPPKTATTNDRGHRASPDYVYQPDKYTVLVAGDSFTWGFGADDAEVWPTLLQRQDPRIHVINLGVGGYGVDQMYVTLRETIDEYKPQLVVFPYIADDLERSLLGFRDYKKPKFILKDNNLVLTNTPIGDTAVTLEELKKKYALPHLLLPLLVRDRLFRRTWDTPPYWEHCFSLNTRIVEEAQRCALARKSDFLLIHLSCGNFLSDATMPGDRGEEFLRLYAGSHQVNIFEAREPFLKSGKKWGVAHYEAPEATFLAEVVWRRIQELDSWRQFLKVKPATSPN